MYMYVPSCPFVHFWRQPGSVVQGCRGDARETEEGSGQAKRWILIISSHIRRVQLSIMHFSKLLCVLCCNVCCAQDCTTCMSQSTLCLLNSFSRRSVCCGNHVHIILLFSCSYRVLIWSRNNNLCPDHRGHFNSSAGKRTSIDYAYMYTCNNTCLHQSNTH